ncbi:hypothetical protein EHI85_10175 [Cronobacter sakazakii]|nr:hypothetical protein [Cronobacter sakazakii]PPX85881.1 hypothetical protein C3D72_18065 [Cronobacter sakazakii]
MNHILIYPLGEISLYAFIKRLKPFSLKHDEPQKKLSSTKFSMIYFFFIIACCYECLKLAAFRHKTKENQ